MKPRVQVFDRLDSVDTMFPGPIQKTTMTPNSVDEDSIADSGYVSRDSGHEDMEKPSLE